MLMKIVSGIFAVGAIGAGLYAAFLWYAAGHVPVAPRFAKAPGWVRYTMRHMLEQAERDAEIKSALLNSNAAIWTAISVFLQAVSTICGWFA